MGNTDFLHMFSHTYPLPSQLGHWQFALPLNRLISSTCLMLLSQLDLPISFNTTTGDFGQPLVHHQVEHLLLFLDFAINIIQVKGAEIKRTLHYCAQLMVSWGLADPHKVAPNDHNLSPQPMQSPLLYRIKKQTQTCSATPHHNNGPHFHPRTISSHPPCPTQWPPTKHPNWHIQNAYNDTAMRHCF
jgi:hypothetical protein